MHLSIVQMTCFAEACMADYDEKGWLYESYHAANSDPVAAFGKP